MKAIVLTFNRPANTKPVSVTDLRLREGGTCVLCVPEIFIKLGLNCARAYTRSISLRGLGPITNSFIARPFTPKTLPIQEGLVYGVLTDTKGPQGYAIEFFEHKTPHTRKNRPRSGPALRARGPSIELSFKA